ncbi:MAG: acyltransferase [Gammaproteobacteria bacterium]|nr:acyltransferase [Gammaproteobacteria bacterium]
MTAFINTVKHFLLAVFTWPITQPIALAGAIIQQPNKAFAVVDFLKGLSVLMVILFHTLFAIFFLFKKSPDKLNAFIQSLPDGLTFLLASDKAVDIFFLLSSFLLSYSLLSIYQKKNRIDIGRFYLHRFFRIYPLFLVALILYGLADPHKLLTEGWYSLLFIENIFSKGIIPVQWSLSIEVQFYLILPFLILFLAKRKRPILWISALIVLSVFARFWIAYQTPAIYQTPWYQFTQVVDAAVYMDAMYYVIEARITPLLLGVLWALILWHSPNTKLTLSNRTKYSLLALGLGVIYLTLQFPVYDSQARFYQPFNASFNLAAISLHRFIFSGTILALILLFHFSKPSKKSNPLIHWKGWRLLSEVAYPMYFFHFPFVAIGWFLILGTVEATEISTIPLLYIPLVFGFAVFSTLYLSLLLNHWVEARFIKMGKQVESRWFSR